MQTSVLVVGAGPAGVTTALLLAQRGVDVALIERETDLARVFRGEGLMPSGVDALRQIGVAEVLEHIPCRNIDSWNVAIDGQEILAVPEPASDTRARVVSQPAFLQALLDMAAKYASFRYRPGVRLRNLLRDGDRVVGAEVESPQGAEHVYADLVIGTDGRGSLVRSRAGIKLDVVPESYDIVWLKLPAPEPLRQRCAVTYLVAGGAPPVVCYTSWDGRLQYGVTIPKGERAEADDADWLDVAVRAAPAWLAEHIRNVRHEIEPPVKLNVIVGRAESWWRDGVLLLGDAAHPMSPIRAQGINHALRDAIVAVNHLTPALQRQPDRAALSAALAAVQSERQPEIVRTQAMQLQFGRDATAVRAGSWKFALARRLVPLLGRFRWAQRAWLRQQTPLWHGFDRVVLKV
jgi:2-polyprenyl-6-methoxyphenol hydroxylase-like FAD-dependent oxidoreductase